MNLQNKISDFLQKDPFQISSEEKRSKFLEIMKLQIEYHLKNCKEYNNWYFKNEFKTPENIENIVEIPFIPSAAFKYINLKSIAKKTKKISSSGTSSQIKSQIYIDSETSKNQTKALSKILSHFLDKKRRPFFIVDLEPNLKNFELNNMSARFAGMQGYLMAAKSRNYLLKTNSEGEIVFDMRVLEYLNKISKKEPPVIIGYTYMIFSHLLNNDRLKFDLNSKTSLIHFGGWKKLEKNKISKNLLNKKIISILNIQKERIFDIYGFTEQLGSVYVSKGNKGCIVPAYSEVIVRDPNTLSAVKDGEEGLLQFLSILPISYPGFSVLNDDLGKLTNVNNSRNTKEFIVSSRLEKAESRGCGDTLPDNFYM
tara:strand:- start:2617 stop:3720 length:1104 start_codon:yes stop_codon:yes gene_type:complete